ncbi:MAG: hypothetical protein WAL61_04810 [Acidimicrobiales bacterium]
MTAPGGADEGPVRRDAFAQTVTGGDAGALNEALDTVGDMLNNEDPETPNAAAVLNPPITTSATT